MVSTPQNFTTKYDLSINGSGIPRSTFGHFYIAVSNSTAGTPLPAWTDESFFYIPFEIPDLTNTSARLFRGRTPAISASLRCLEQVKINGSSTWEVSAGSSGCDSTTLSYHKDIQSQHPNATEVMSFSSKLSAKNADLDRGLTVLAGWERSSTRPRNDSSTISKVGCQPEIHVEIREVTVNSQGLVQSSSTVDDIAGDQNTDLDLNSTSIIDAVHELLDYSNVPRYPDFLNFLMVQRLKSSAILDPGVPPPCFDVTVPVLKALYRSIFAIILGAHISTILSESRQTTTITGSTLAPEVRVFVSKSTFSISAAILGLYVLVTIALYVRRLWKTLPRMPTTIASEIAFFAASHALNDFTDTSRMPERHRNLHIGGLRRRYGYGRFVDTDGKTHIGIEREPLVRVLSKADVQSMQKTAMAE
ncbi:hypothetical protein E4T38_05514 [Aureobasidium subglaciale]|nr:hypothetical protein E4T38_05514 [Aureobasidium subglaciale]KAI5221592.1 hypothetical protein E4T40_05352 [Aureobasidium subglaciale]KAI5225470.1 hypothetical protein E4T41_05266 [Aureobasidium subglaciale]KAI5261451.1 hypothetical protein E4T46_05063 [Aureobasidium subglaciale]